MAKKKAKKSNASTQMVRTEFAAAIMQIANDRKIPVESIYEAIKSALVSAYRKQFADQIPEDKHHIVDLNNETGEARILEVPVTERDEETEEVLAWDDSNPVDVTPAGFGRIAAQTAKQVIIQKIRESEKAQVISDFQNRIGEVVTGTVLRMEGRTVVIDLGRGYAYMPPEEQMRGEFYRMNMRVAVLVADIRDTFKGRRVIVSRADTNLVSQLFAREVPEVAAGAVEIVSISREAGVRTKMAVRATQDGVDPVGSCVGQRGVRVQEVIKELNNEKIDIIPWSEDERLYIQAALAPAESLLIEINKSANTVTVTAPDEQLSLAIGRGGQNVRLAAKLLGMKITIKSAGGDVESQVSGDEQYEIDTFEGIEPETRQKLIDFKLTTVNDLERFQEKWQNFDDLSDEQKAVIQTAIEAARAQERERFPQDYEYETATEEASSDEAETSSETATEASDK